MMDFDNDEDNVDMSSNNESNTKDESEDDAGDLLSEDLDLLGIIDDVSKMIKEKVDELKEDFLALGSDCFNRCSEEKIRCLGHAVDSMLRSGSIVMSPQKIKFIRKLIMPYHKTVRKIANPKVSTHEKRKLLQKAQVGEGVLESFKKIFRCQLRPQNVVRTYINGEMRFEEMYFKIISDKN